MILRDRRQAGELLAMRLVQRLKHTNSIVLALPRGGVPVGFEIAKHLHVPMDVLMVRKLGVPGQEELAMGAIASDGIRVINRDIFTALSIDAASVERVVQREEQELKRRVRVYRGDRPALNVADKQVILVDDGIATGATMRVAIRALRQQSPERIIVAVPVAPPGIYDDLRTADEVVCLITPEPFYGVGQWYHHFGQVSDHTVRTLLHEAESIAFEHA